MAKVPGAKGATYDRGRPKGTRESAKPIRRGKLGSGDFNAGLDAEKQHGAAIRGGNFYTDRQDLIDEAQKHIEEIIDRHATSVQPVKFRRQSYAEHANQFSVESRPLGVNLNTLEPIDAEDPFDGPSNQAKRGGRSA